MSRVSDDRTLVLLRHAKAEQVPGKPDHDRELTDRGARDAAAAGTWLRDQGIVAELVICSTSRRTRQTWEFAARGGAHTEFVEYRRSVYQSGTSGILETIREDAGEVRTVVLVGHAPTHPRPRQRPHRRAGIARRSRRHGGGVPDLRARRSPVCR